jgi:hypothetical protein
MYKHCRGAVGTKAVELFFFVRKCELGETVTRRVTWGDRRLFVLIYCNLILEARFLNRMRIFITLFVYHTGVIKDCCVCSMLYPSVHRTQNILVTSICRHSRLENGHWCRRCAGYTAEYNAHLTVGWKTVTWNQQQPSTSVSTRSCSVAWTALFSTFALPRIC